MEAKYPTLRRPKRKLCYITPTGSSSNQWQKVLTLEDVDTMFDNIDVCSLDSHSPPVLLQSSDSGTSQTELDIPFKSHDPVKTSSPIKQDTCKTSMEKPGDKNKRVVSHSLFNCDDEVVQEPEKDPLPTQKPLCKGAVAEKSDVDLESPPSTITLTRKLSHKEMEKPSCHESTEPSGPEARNKPALCTPEKNSESVATQPPAQTRSHVGKDMTAFLQKLRLAPQSKATQKSFSKALPPPPRPLSPPPPPPRPEPEDDFLILEDDTPLWVTIPSKTATKKKQKLNKTSSIDKESSDKGSKDSSPETAQEEQELEKINNQQENQVDDQKVKRKRGKEENNQVIGSGKDEDDEDSLRSPEDHPAGNSSKQQKTKKKERQPKKVPLKEREEVKDLPEDGVDVETEKPKEAETTAHKSTKRKKLKDEKQITKSGTNTLKKSRKAPQKSNAVEEVADVDVGEQSDGEPADTEDMGSFPEKEILKPEADGKTRQNKLSDMSEEHSPKDGQGLAKRERKQTGQWWLLDPQSSEETESPQPLKKSKKKGKEPRAAAPSAVQAKKDKVHKKTNQKQPASLSSDNMNKRKQTKKRKAKEEKIKETEDVICAAEISDGDLEQEQEQSSPLVFPKRDVSLKSGGQIFQKVYLKSTNETVSVTPTAPVLPIQHKDQLKEAGPASSRRKPVGNWWEINNAADNSGGIASQPQERPLKEPKPLKEQRRQRRQGRTGLGSHKNSNAAAGSKPPGGAVVSPVKPLLTPKTVKRSLATFKDIFTSNAETPTVVANRGAHQRTRRNVTSRPAEQAHDTDSVTYSRTDKNPLSGDVGEWRGSQNQQTPQGGECGGKDMLKVLTSGPSSMIELENYESNDDMDLPSSRVQTALSAADLCAPPLKPLTLHARDKSNLTEWFQSLWSTADDSATITPDQFQWYFYQDRALGIQVDLNSSSICSGKILMGSYMKKPLWVDHSATTVFNLLTSSVSVTVDGSSSRYGPGQAFMVECGRAYSIQNTISQPAVLYFTRMLAESQD